MTTTKEGYNQIRLSAEGSREVANDLMRAQMYVTQTGTDPHALADQVNRVLNAAKQTAEACEAVRVQSGNYNTQPLHRYNDATGETVQTGWQISAGLMLESKDFRQLSELIGRLQGDMQLGQVDFAASPALQQQTENDLMVEAIRAFNTRAEIVGQTLGASEHLLKEMAVQTNSRGRSYPRMAVALAAGGPAEVETPQFNEGTSTVSITVSGTIELVK